MTTENNQDFFDEITNPSHYNKNREIAPIDYCRSIGRCMEGNPVKYIARLHTKGNPLVDAKKCVQYMNFEIEWLKAKTNTLFGINVFDVRDDWDLPFNPGRALELYDAGTKAGHSGDVDRQIARYEKAVWFMEREIKILELKG